MANKIYKICENVLEITDEEIAELTEVYEGQLAYCHPFKMATAEKQHKLGAHNRDVVNRLMELRSALRASADI